LYNVNVVNDIPWYDDIVNYLVSTTVVPKIFSKSQANNLKSYAKYYFWDDPYLWRFLLMK